MRLILHNSSTRAPERMWGSTLWPDAMLGVCALCRWPCGLSLSCLGVHWQRTHIPPWDTPADKQSLCYALGCPNILGSAWGCLSPVQIMHCRHQALGPICVQSLVGQHSLMSAGSGASAWPSSGTQIKMLLCAWARTQGGEGGGGFGCLLRGSCGSAQQSGWWAGWGGCRASCPRTRRSRPGGPYSKRGRDNDDQLGACDGPGRRWRARLSMSRRGSGWPGARIGPGHAQAALVGLCLSRSMQLRHAAGLPKALHP